MDASTVCARAGIAANKASTYITIGLGPTFTQFPSAGPRLLRNHDWVDIPRGIYRLPQRITSCLDDQRATRFLDGGGKYGSKRWLASAAISL
jgi:hypothetical protein